jgi:DMSO/TMAO reductase YedYZ molybdopterin-dependent catalytic subunit
VPPKPAPNYVVQPTPSNYFISRGNGSEEMNFGAAEDYGDYVPNDRMYIHSRAAAPKLDVAAWRLHVGGSAIAEPRSFTYEELRALPSVKLRRVLDCGVNCRAFFPKVSPYKSLKWLPVGWTQWHFGAVGATEWTGVRVKDVLDAAGLGQAADAEFISLDSIATTAGQLPYSQVIAIDKVLADDTLLAYEMAGEPIPIDHGFPLRAIFSGWGGNSAVKWLGRIEVSKDPLPLSHFQRNQVLAGPDYPEEILATVGPVRSALELAENVTVFPGDQTLHGRAWSGAGAIQQVEVCIEREMAPGRWMAVWDPAWRAAKLLHKAEPMMWVRFEIAWKNAEPGHYRLMTRATDDAGRIQPAPEEMVWNQHGLGYNGHAPLELSVSPMSNMP